MNKKTLPCTISGCEKLQHGRGWCKTHWQKWSRHGDPLGSTRKPYVTGPLATRFWTMVDKAGSNECWLWIGKKGSKGYGLVHVDSRSGRQQQAHRAAYELTVGPIPPGLEIDHLCRVRACVNPAHLEPVTRAENMRRMWEHRRKEVG